MVRPNLDPSLFRSPILTCARVLCVALQSTSTRSCSRTNRRSWGALYYAAGCWNLQIEDPLLAYKSA